MFEVKPKLKEGAAAAARPAPVREAAAHQPGLQSGARVAAAGEPLRKSNQPAGPARRTPISEQTRITAIVGDATFKGAISVDGAISGQPGNTGGVLSVKQHGRSFFGQAPELDGEIVFKDMLRVNGHIAGKVCSPRGTLIVDTLARVEADVDVAVAIISGTVRGDIIARDRVELATTAKIYGNIWTPSLVIQNGAIFEGVCQMFESQAI